MGVPRRVCVYTAPERAETIQPHQPGQRLAVPPSSRDISTHLTLLSLRHTRVRPAWRQKEINKIKKVVVAAAKWGRKKEDIERRFGGAARESETISRRLPPASHRSIFSLPRPALRKPTFSGCSPPRGESICSAATSRKKATRSCLFPFRSRRRLTRGR